MPYTMMNLPDAVKKLSEREQQVWMETYNKADKEHPGDEARCAATAWAAVKKIGADMSEWIPIMKTGTHTDSAGNQHTFDEARLDKIAASYDPAKHEAPVVIGHPEENAPAWAWVEALKRVGNMLFYREKGSRPEFDDMRKKGLFKKRSLSLYEDGTLRHVGWLGAMPPAVKGLPDVAFAEGGASFEFTEFPHERDKSKEGIKMKIKEFLRGLAKKDGVSLEDEPQSFSEADLKAAREKAEKEGREKAVAEFAEQKKKDEAQFAEREKALKAMETEARKQSVAAFCEGLKKQGKLTPAMEKLGMGITNFLQEIGRTETVIEFGEEGKKQKQTPLEFMRAFLAALPARIEFKEVAGNDKDVPAAGRAGEKIDALVREKLKANKEMKYAAAFAEVQQENPALAAEYEAEIRG